MKSVPVAKERYRIAPLGAHRESWRTPMEQDPAAISLADRVARVDQEFERIDWKDPRVRSARVSTDVGTVRRLFIDRDRRLSSEATTVAHNVVLFGFDQGKPGFAFARRNGQGGLELTRLTDEALERMRRDFVESFGAEQVPAGEYEVVFSPSVSGLLAHESFGHGVEMDQFVKDRAKAREVPRQEGGLGDRQPARRPVDRGRARLLSVRRRGRDRRPHADHRERHLRAAAHRPHVRDLPRRPPHAERSRQGWDRKVYARMSNTFIAKGSSDKAEVLASLKNGLYLEGFRNGIEDPQGWGIQFTASTAREYKDGKPTGRLFAPATVTGYVPEILSNVTLVGNDFELEPGTCGKGFKEFVPVTSGGPHLRTRARVS